MIDIANNFEENFQSNRFYLNFQQLLFNLEMKFKEKEKFLRNYLTRIIGMKVEIVFAEESPNYFKLIQYDSRTI